jgi:hypothetical protein
MPLEIDLTAEDMKAGAHWLADKAPAEFEKAPLPAPGVIVGPWPIPFSPENPSGPPEQTSTKKS